MKSVGAPSTSGVPVVTDRLNRPTRPMSWYSGSHDTSTSSSGSRAVACAMASRLAPTVRCGSITPFGSEVDPLVNWRIAKRSRSSGGRSQASAPSRPAPGCTASQLDHRRIARNGLDERSQLGVDQHQRHVGVDDAASGSGPRTPRSRRAASGAAARRRWRRSARSPGSRWPAAARWGRGGRRGRRGRRPAPGGWRRSHGFVVELAIRDGDVVAAHHEGEAVASVGPGLDPLGHGQHIGSDHRQRTRRYSEYRC